MPSVKSFSVFKLKILLYQAKYIYKLSGLIINHCRLCLLYHFGLKSRKASRFVEKEVTTTFLVGEIERVESMSQPVAF